MRKIHPTAIVESGAELDDDVEIMPFSVIGPHVRIGRGTVVGPHCVIDGRTVIGEGNRLFSGAQVGVLSQDLKHKAGLIGRCIVGNYNIIRESVTISACTMMSEAEEDRVTSVGNNCMFMAYSHVAHDCHVGNGVIMANCASLAGHVDVEDRAILGGLSGIHQECVVGTLAFVGGLSRVAKDVPPYMIVDGNPAKCCGPNAVGLKRAGLDVTQRSRIRQMYRIMFRSDLNTTQAIQEIKASVEECPEREHFIDFISKSSRGIIK